MLSRRDIRRTKCALFLVLMLLASCTKEGDIIYVPDPSDMPDTSPLVTVVYDPDALGDRSYNDLIYSGVEAAALKYHMRTMQLSPSSREEGLREALTEDDREALAQAYDDAQRRTLWERITRSNHEDVTFYKGLLQEYTRDLLLVMREDFLEEVEGHDIQ